MINLFKSFFSTIVILIILGLVVTPIHSGEVVIDWEVLIDGYFKTKPVVQGKRIDVCYISHRYAFATGEYDYIYTVFIITPRFNIKNSVGKGGANEPKDVVKIKKILNKLNFYNNELDDKIDNHLINAIIKFQKEVAYLEKPDGKIEADKKTLNVLRVENSNKLFIELLKRSGDGIAKSEMMDCVSFYAPQRIGIYDIFYCQLSYISASPVGRPIRDESQDVIILNAADERMLKRDHLRKYATRIEHVGSIRVVPKEGRLNIPFTVYLKVNDKSLVLETKIKPGASNDPMTFSWFEKPEFTNEIEYRYRLNPDYKNWSNWNKEKVKEYYFISAGYNRFEVQTRYRNSSGKWNLAPIAGYNFNLDRAFVSKPPLKKILEPDSTNKIYSEEEATFRDVNWSEVYGNSKALLIGVEYNDDANFKPLPYIKQDVMSMEKTFKELGFEVKSILGKIKRQRIISSIQEFLKDSKKNERLIVYISTHGFSAKNVNSIGYIAPSDCIYRAPYDKCLQLDYIEEILQKTNNTKVKHLLFILDSCSSGLGVISKDIEYPEIEIALENGSHMITAGMADQTARMENKLKMSIFTHYLAKGLSGEADLIEDGVVSLTELLLYVRYQVAEFTDGDQTPMIGRLSGAGEMVFKLK